MKRTLNLLLSLLILFSFSLCVSAQSDVNELDQVKLLKQYVGTWEMIIGKDSVMLFKVIPNGNGLVFNLDEIAQGKIISSSPALMGLFDDNRKIVLHIMWQNGTVATEIGRFVSNTKIVMERFREEQPNHAVLLSETEFIDPDTFTMVYYGRGQNITWEPQWESRWTFTRVKE